MRNQILTLLGALVLGAAPSAAGQAALLQTPTGHTGPYGEWVEIVTMDNARFSWKRTKDLQSGVHEVAWVRIENVGPHQLERWFDVVFFCRPAGLVDRDRNSSVNLGPGRTHSTWYMPCDVDQEITGAAIYNWSAIPPWQRQQNVSPTARAGSTGASPAAPVGEPAASAEANRMIQESQARQQQQQNVIGAVATVIGGLIQGSSTNEESRPRQRPTTSHIVSMADYFPAAPLRAPNDTIEGQLTASDVLVEWNRYLTHGFRFELTAFQRWEYIVPRLSSGEFSRVKFFYHDGNSWRELLPVRYRNASNHLTRVFEPPYTGEYRMIVFSETPSPYRVITRQR